VADFLARLDLADLSLARGFDQLLCEGHLPGVERHWYQIETVRKVLRQFRGRVLLGTRSGWGRPSKRE